MKPQKFISLYCGLSLLLSGCGSMDYLQTGFDYYNRGYTALPESSALNESLVIKNIRVIIVDPPDQYQPERIANKNDSKARAVTEPDHEMLVIGKRLNGKIMLNQIVLGNELKQLMHLTNPSVACPWDLEAFESCLDYHSPEECNELIP